MSWFFKSFQAIVDDISAESQPRSPFPSSECVRRDDFSTLAVAVAADSFDSSSNSSSPILQGIRNDLAEIGGGLRDGFSILSVSSRKAVGEISRFASNLVPFQRRSADDEEDEEFEDEFINDRRGITDEVLNFVAEISSRPQYWTDFPLALVHSDFEMSYLQRIHTSTVEQLIPNISALKAQLRSFMSNELFWLVYFVLVLPKFNRDDFELLATRQILETRNLLIEKFQRKVKSQVHSDDDDNLECGTQKGNMPSLEKANSTRTTQEGEGLEIQDGDEENTNQRLKMGDSRTCTDAKERDGGLEGNPFSDIEDDWTNLSGRFSVTNPPRTSSSTESSDWVKVHENLDSKLNQQKTWKQDRDSEAEDWSDWSNMDGFY